MKRFAINTILILVCFLLQSTVFKAFNVNGIIPNVLVILTASCGFMQGERTGMFVGFVCGLLIDLFSFDVIGLSALLFMFLGYLNGKFHNTFYLEDIKLPLILLTCSDLFYSLFTYVCHFLLRSRFDFGFYFLNIILPELAYTVLISILIYPIILLTEFLYRKYENAKESAN